MGPIYGGALDLVIFDRVSFGPGPVNLTTNMYGGGPGGSKGVLDFFFLTISPIITTKMNYNFIFLAWSQRLV